MSVDLFLLTFFSYLFSKDFYLKRLQDFIFFSFPTEAPLVLENTAIVWQCLKPD